MAFVRAGYVLQGLWVPEFVLDYPDVLRQQHYEFARAGSDVMEAYQVHSYMYSLHVSPASVSKTALVARSYNAPTHLYLQNGKNT